MVVQLHQFQCGSAKCNTAGTAPVLVVLYSFLFSWGCWGYLHFLGWLKEAWSVQISITLTQIVKSQLPSSIFPSELVHWNKRDEVCAIRPITHTRTEISCYALYRLLKEKFLSVMMKAHVHQAKGNTVDTFQARPFNACDSMSLYDKYSLGNRKQTSANVINKFHSIPAEKSGADLPHCSSFIYVLDQVVWKLSFPNMSVFCVGIWIDHCDSMSGFAFHKCMVLQFCQGEHCF